MLCQIIVFLIVPVFAFRFEYDTHYEIPNTYVQTQPLSYVRRLTDYPGAALPLDETVQPPKHEHHQNQERDNVIWNLNSMSPEDIKSLLDRSVSDLNDAITAVDVRKFWITADEVGQVLKHKREIMVEVNRAASSLYDEDFPSADALSARRRLQFSNNWYGRNRGNSYGLGGIGNNVYNNGYGRNGYGKNGYGQSGYGMMGRGRNVCCRQCRQGDVSCLTYCERIC